jgi:hypothetical protein
LVEILTGCLLFAGLIGGLGLPLTAELPLEGDEQLMLGAVAGCVVVYLAAWVVYWCRLPPLAFGVLPAAAVAALWRRRQAVGARWRAPETRRLAGLWLILAGWCLGLLALVRSYSGGEWIGDWIEHYQRAQFFLERQPLDTLFLHRYALTARPPLASLVTSAFLALTGSSFAWFQVFNTLLATLAFFPAAVLARRFRAAGTGADPAAVLLVLLMLSPMFVENATFSWTKLPAAFFTLAGLHFYVRYEAARENLLILCAAVCLAAAVLTHYSAAPYVVVLGVAWLAARRTRLLRPDFWRELLPPVAAALALLGTWLVWSAWHYGPAGTFFSNSTVTGTGGQPALQQLADRGLNLFSTLVPHPLRTGTGYEFVTQTSRLSWWRDYFFNIYQTNLPLAFGSGGVVALAALVWGHRRGLRPFWVWFAAGTGLLSIAVVSMPAPDRWGLTHVGLQPLVMVGLAWLASALPELNRGLRGWLAVGLAVDFCLGIVLQFRVQHLEFPPDLFATHRDQALLATHGYATWNNFLAKCVLQLGFLGDGGPPAAAWCALLGVLLVAAVRLALRHDHGNAA